MPWDAALGNSRTGWLARTTNVTSGARHAVGGSLSERLDNGLGLDEHIDKTTSEYQGGQVAGQVINVAASATPVGAILQGVQKVGAVVDLGEAAANGDVNGVVAAAITLAPVPGGKGAAGQVAKKEVAAVESVAVKGFQQAEKTGLKQAEKAGLQQAEKELQTEGSQAAKSLVGGAKRGPKIDPNAPHNAKIRQEAQKLTDQGNEIISGGGGKERLIPTPGGVKSGRRPDIEYRTPGGEIRGRNVGKTKADGTPVPREVDAINDLTNHGGVPTDFVPYDR